ncbi:MAG TPA: hypothetical protein VGR95_20515 [Thermoanaerobaculia bacterium]|jgi:hypothetical protein|nr:hypothetical protein [Thermoanaerobaculia bacterium]
MEEELTSEPEVTREEALAMVAAIKHKMDVLSARYRTMREPDERLGDLPGPSQLRRTARRVRAGLFKPTWMTESAEELAREYDYAAEFIETEINARRLASRYKRMLEDVEDGFYDDVKDDFDDLKARVRDFDAI